MAARRPGGTGGAGRPSGRATTRCGSAAWDGLRAGEGFRPHHRIASYGVVSAIRPTHRRSQFARVNSIALGALATCHTWMESGCHDASVTDAHPYGQPYNHPRSHCGNDEPPRGGSKIEASETLTLCLCSSVELIPGYPAEFLSIRNVRDRLFLVNSPFRF